MSQKRIREVDSEYTRWDDTNDHTEIITPQCHHCVHWHIGTIGCDAFPGAAGIPIAILSNEVIHDHEIDGDHGIQFEAKP